MVASYLVHLFHRGLKPATIKVHRAAVQSVLKHIAPQLASSALLHDLCKRFEIERPRTVRVLPKFDLNLVLWQMLKPPFVDKAGGTDYRIPLSTMVAKVTFLLALATGSRTSELHALSRARGALTWERFPEGKRVVSMKPFPRFLAKNDRPDRVPSPIVIPSMDHIVGREPERLWCPVRAVEIYLARTPDGPYAADDFHLLRHPKSTVRTTKGHIALWIRRAVTLAYEAAGEGTESVHCNPHEVRAIAHSLAAYNGASLREVIQGGRWSSSEPFFRHYLRDMSETLSGSIGRRPLIVAGNLLNA